MSFHAVASLFLLLCISATRSFVPAPHHAAWGVTHGRAALESSTIRFASNAGASDNDSSHSGNHDKMELANDFEMFLTQCSIQSFMFLARSMRDPQTVMWIEDFTQPAIVQLDTGCDLVTVLADAREEHEQQDAEDDDDDDDDIIEAIMDANVAAASSMDEANDRPHLPEHTAVSMIGEEERTTVPSVLYFASVTETVIDEVERESETGIPFFASLIEPSTNRDESIDTNGEETAIQEQDEDTDIDEDDECSTESQGERKFSKLLQYHGLAALNTTIFPTWDVYFERLLQEPTVVYIVESDSPYVPDYELEIDPSSLCSRIISVREQISKEFVNDLNVIAHMGGSALESYWDTLKARSENNETDAPLFQRESLLFLELSPENSVHGPSPLRKGNFDLLLLLTTQASIHRVLNDESRQSGPERVTNEFLKQFYMERAHYFRGPQQYGRADDFLEELLKSSPKLITVSEGVTSLIDPTRIAELIVHAREAIALEWKEIAEESPKEHMAIQRMRLNRMMGVTDTAKGAEEPFQ